TTVLLAAAIAASLPNAQPLPQPPAADATPAMFMVRDADTTVYIFGTFHALDGQTHWFGERVKEAFDQSNELVLETLIPEGPMLPGQFRQSFRPPSVTPSASFLATTRMAINAGRAQGMQV